MTFIKKIFLLIFVAGAFASCDNIVDVEQPGRLNADAAYQSVSDLESGLLGAYSQLDVSSEIRFNAAFTDEASIGVENGGQSLGGLYNFVLNAGTDGAEALWTTNYDAINAATRLIDAAENIQPESGQEANYNSIVGQAHAIRAFAHMKLMTYFAEDLTDDSSLGVIAIDEVPEISDQPSRNTTGEVFSLILNDLSKAESLIPASQTSVTRFSQDAITAMRARIALYRGNYSTAETESQALLDKYNLANRQEYLEMFQLDTDGEVIFKLERTVGDPYDGQGDTGDATAGGWAGAVFAFTGPDIAGAPYLEMGRTLFNILDPNDIRYDVNVSPASQLDPNYPNSNPDNFGDNDIIPINKYRGSVPGENQPLMNDLKIFRLSEMLLINAEAEVAANSDLAAAATLIKQLRDARFGSSQPLPTFSSEQEAYAAILEERRKELAFEGHRWVDLGRLGANANAEIDRDQLDCQPYGACEGNEPKPGNDHRYRFPIPLVEIDGNNQITQNPGY